MSQSPQHESLGSLVEDFDRQHQSHAHHGGGGGGEGGGPGRSVVLALVALAILGVAAVFAARALRSETASLEAWSKSADLIDMETGEVFKDFPIPDGAAFPLTNPNTGTQTLTKAEACYWNADGTAKLEPTLVYVPTGEVVTCPDCGRDVRGRNPSPPVELMVEALDRKEAAEGKN